MLPTINHESYDMNSTDYFTIQIQMYFEKVQTPIIPFDSRVLSVLTF